MRRRYNIPGEWVCVDGGKEKYDYLIGMIEGCMNEDNNIVETEKLLESLLMDLRFKYPVFSPIDSVVEFHSYKLFPFPVNEWPDMDIIEDSRPDR